MQARQDQATALVLWMVITVAACRSAPLCYDGEFRGCRCSDGALGYQRCEEGSFASCTCDGSTPGLKNGASSSASGGGAGGGMLLPLYSPCQSDAECASKDCGDFPAKGPHCTKSCVAPQDCPPPSSGCNPKGQCKLPD